MNSWNYWLGIRGSLWSSGPPGRREWRRKFELWRPSCAHPFGNLWQAVCNKIRRHSDVDVRLPHVDVRLSDVDVKAHVDVKSQDVDVEPRRRDVDVEVTATCSLVLRLLFTERENFFRQARKMRSGNETRRRERPDVYVEVTSI